MKAQSEAKLTHRVSLNGKWLIDYLSQTPYEGTDEPDFFIEDTGNEELDTSGITECTVPAYFEDMLDDFRRTPLHTKLSWNPLYTLQRYPQAGYCPDMALPNPVCCFIYRREFSLQSDELCDEAELYVGGVQNALSAWINGAYLGRHEGYSAEFFLPIPKGVLKSGENVITLAVSNTRLAGYKGRPVSGLTSRAANECTGGIFGDVEIRSYPDGLKEISLSVSDDLTHFTITVSGAADKVKTLRISDGGKTLYTAELGAGKSELIVSCEGYERWSPTSPKLYTLTLETEAQRIERRFGIRKLTAAGRRLLLNGEPFFFRGSCEHCYHPISVHPTREKTYYRGVIRTLKSLGFNSIRFHTHVPMPEYLEAADELGMVIEVETPNNTDYEEWRGIVDQCSRYTSVCIFSSGNEMQIDEDYIEHLSRISDYVHHHSDALLSPMSALRGVEYYGGFGPSKLDTPFTHDPERLAALDAICDVYNSYSLGLTSYESLAGDPALLDERNAVYQKPLLSHEICIHGTYADLSLKNRYRGSRIGDTELFSSVEKHLESVGLIDKASTYYRNSVKWQMLLRKHCFETVRRSHSFAGYDFLGDIDTHWHTFGYCVGMMNEFYELKAPESTENVLKYNADTVLLCDMPKRHSFFEGEKLTLPVLVSNYGEHLRKAKLALNVKADGKLVCRKELSLTDIRSGEITELCKLNFAIPRTGKPQKLVVSASLFGESTDVRNEWELYAFPKVSQKTPHGVAVRENISLGDLVAAMSRGESLVLFGCGPFKSSKMSFQLSVAGRTNGHLATVIADHAALEDFPHDGFCGWQFENMLDTRTAILDGTVGVHAPIIDAASSYKNAHREALLFEYRVGEGRLLVCTLKLDEADPAAAWLKARLLAYAASESFAPRASLDAHELMAICGNGERLDGQNENAAINKNDVTML